MATPQQRRQRCRNSLFLFQFPLLTLCVRRRQRRRQSETLSTEFTILNGWQRTFGVGLAAAVKAAAAKECVYVMMCSLFTVQPVWIYIYIYVMLCSSLLWRRTRFFVSFRKNAFMLPFVAAVSLLPCRPCQTQQRSSRAGIFICYAQKTGGRSWKYYSYYIYIYLYYIKWG